MIRSKKAIILFYILLVICFSSLLGCSNQKNEIDTFDFGISTMRKDATSLKDHDCEMELTANIESVQITQDYLCTNTKQIAVSSDDVMKDTEISLFLYNSESNDPIGYATLTCKETTAVFTNLSSSEIYKIGATIKNSPEPVKIIITD